MQPDPSGHTGIVVDVAAPESRIGGTLCSGLPWLPPEHLESPQGMLERPPGCESPKACATDRVCWAAKRREMLARGRHERFLADESGEVVELTHIDVKRRTKAPEVVDDVWADDAA